jgi:hypothetical protein
MFRTTTWRLFAKRAGDQRPSRDRLTRQPQEHQHSAAESGMRDRLPPARDTTDKTRELTRKSAFAQKASR